MAATHVVKRGRGIALQGRALVALRSKARNAILAEWDNWAEAHGQGAAGREASGGDTTAHMVLFHAHLLENRPDLLNFEYSTADKSEVIRSWLVTARRIKG